MLKSKIKFVMLIALLFISSVPLFGQTIPPATKEQESKLIAVLKSDAPYKDKADACRQLAVIGTKDAVGPLAALLGDEKLSHMARYGLEPNPDPAVDEALRNALGKVKGRPLVGVIGSIGVRRDAKAVRALAKMLRSRDAEVAEAAARALGRIANRPATRALQRALRTAPADNKLALCEGLFRCAEAQAAAGRRDVAINIYDQLRRLDGPHQVRAGALRGAILTRGKDGVTLLKEYLHSNDYIMFSAAVQAAQEMSGAEVTEALTSALEGLPADNQVLVIQILGVRGDTGALPALFSLAKEGKKSVRLAAIKGLAELVHRSSVAVLVELLQDSDGQIRQAAKESLGAFPYQQTYSDVLRMLKSSDTDKQLTAIELFGRQRVVSSIPELLKVARDGDPKVRPAAIRMVGELGGAKQASAILNLLMELTASDDLNAASAALKAVCPEVDDRQAILAQITRLMPAASPGQKGVLLQVLGVVGGADALTAVRKATKDSDAGVRNAAIRVLCGWKTADAAPDLLRLAKTSSEATVATAALRGYIRLVRDKGLSTGEKLAMCKEAAGLVQRDEEKKLLLGVLAEVASAEALAMAIEHLDKAATKNEACFAAVAISEKIVGQNPGQVADALQKVIKATNNKNLIRRAKAVLGKAKRQ